MSKVHNFLLIHFKRVLTLHVYTKKKIYKYKSRGKIATQSQQSFLVSGQRKGDGVTL